MTTGTTNHGVLGVSGREAHGGYEDDGCAARRIEMSVMNVMTAEQQQAVENGLLDEAIQGKPLAK